MYDQVRKQNKKVENVGPLVGDQHELIQIWWRKIAVIYNPNLHYSFINDVPEPIVTKFLIKKGVVMDEN